MARALELSRLHAGLTESNPSVGCVVVKDGKIVGEAVTAVGGRPHAETQALDLAADKAKGADVYVTLEPCSHYGKTPPCANALVAAQVARVVVCLTDPDPRVAGRGLSILRDAGIAVETGLMQGEGRRVLAGYLTRQTKGRPHVTLKLAVSADGMLGRRGEEVLITGPEVKEEVFRLRAQSDAILVGIGTVLSDDPELTVRISGMEDRSPIRLVMDRKLQIPLSSRLVQTARQVPVIVLVGAEAASEDLLSDRREHLQQAGVEVVRYDDLSTLLHTLAERGISSLLVEGGAMVGKAFLDAQLVDRILLSQGVVTVGEGGLESPVTESDMPFGFKMIRSTALGRDRLLEYERSI
jgi:diaminohydroxyphosphoribosylaminopyrimidine deaminase/5-amino-6-(5-phosphoribosylamino)uracil reductase